MSYEKWLAEEYKPLYGGCGGGSGGGGTTVSQVNVPAKTENETALDTINRRVAERQELQNLQASALDSPTEALAYLGNPSQGGVFQGLETLDNPEFRTRLTTAQTEQADTKSFNDVINRQLTARLTGKAFLTPEEQTALDQLYETSKQQGEESLTEYGQQIAAQRGMRTSDSPIGNEMVREKGRMELGLQAAKASSSLDLATSQKTFEESIRQFQAGLKQQAFNNRLALSTAAPLSFNLASALASQRFQGVSQQTSNTNQLGFGQVASGIGGGLVGLGLGMSGRS